MLFPTHLVAGYLLSRWRSLPVLGVVLGTALPDLVDKPLAMVGVVDLYHTAGHSLLVMVTVGGLWTLVARHELALAVWVGWGSHLVLDAVPMVVNGRPDDVQFLLWPLVVHVPAVHLPPLAFAQYYIGTPAVLLEAGIGVVFVGVLLAESGPGWSR